MARLTIKDRVEAGAALLDRHVPNWDRRIDLDKLNIASAEFCICGQLANTSRSPKVKAALEDPSDGYGVFLEYLEEKRPDAYVHSHDYGFAGGSMHLLTKAWKALIEGRRGGA